MTYVVSSMTHDEREVLRKAGWDIIDPRCIDFGANTDFWAIHTHMKIAEVAAKLTPPPADFGARVADLFAHGLEDAEVLRYLDPDTAGEDLVALVRKLMTKTAERPNCKFCYQPIAGVAYPHGDGLWVCDRCWDERLRSTS